MPNIVQFPPEAIFRHKCDRKHTINYPVQAGAAILPLNDCPTLRAAIIALHDEPYVEEMRACQVLLDSWDPFDDDWEEF